MSAPQLGGYSGQGLGGGGGGLFGFLTQALQGYEASHKQRLDEQQQKTENDYKKQQLEAENKRTDLEAQALQAELPLKKAQATAAEMANNAAIRVGNQDQYKAVLANVFAHPEMAKDPGVVQTLTGLSQSLGMPPIKLKKDGSVDVDSLTRPITEFPDQKALQWALQQDNGVKNPFLDGLRQQGYSVPKDLYTAGPAIGQVRNAMVKNLYYQRHTEQMDKTAAANAATRRKYVDEQGELIPARVTDYYAKAHEETANAAAAGTRAQAAMITANAAATRAAAYTQQVKQGRGGGGAEGVRILSSLTSAYDTAQREVTAAETAYNVANAANPGDLSDPAIVQAGQILTEAKDRLTAIGTERDDLYGSLTSGQPAANFISSAGGNPTRTADTVKPSLIGNAPSGAADGYYPSAKGGPVTIKSGKMYRGKV